MWFLWKSIALIWWYIAWSMIVSSLDPKKKKKIEKIKKDWWDVFAFLIQDFTDTQKELFESLKKEILTPENRKKFETKKQELLKLSNAYMKKAEKTLKDLENKWKNSAKAWLDELDKIYDEQKDKIDEIKEIAPQKALELKDKILSWAMQIKDEIVKKIK